MRQRLTQLGALLVALTMVSVASASAASIARVGSLSPGSGLVVDGVAASGRTVVAGVRDALGRSGGLVVFAKPSGGWGSSQAPSAVLTDPAAVSGLVDPSVSAGTVIAAAVDASGAGYEDVFLEPAGGWSGVVTPAAQLLAPVALGPSVISGSTVVAAAAKPAPLRGALYVFRQPLAGWAGKLSPTATLVDSRLDSVGAPLAVAGGDVFATALPPPIGGLSVFVDRFSAPPGGWTGVVSQSATLWSSGGLFGSGSMLAMDRGVFTRPASDPRPSAYLALFGSDSVAAFDGSFVATSDPWFANGNLCPCSRAVTVFREPRGGWRGSIGSTSTLTITTATDSPGLALSGDTLFAADHGVIAVEDVFGADGRVLPRPRITATIASTHSRRPFVRITVAARPGGLALSSVSVTAIAALSLKPHSRGVKVSGAPRALRTIAHDQLNLFLRLPSPRVAISLRPPALRVKPGSFDCRTRRPRSRLRVRVLLIESASGEPITATVPVACATHG